MQAVLVALAEPRRREILRLVRDREMLAGEIAARFPDVARPTVSEHLRVLRDAGLVRCEVRAQQRIYSIEPRAMVDVDEWLAPYRRLWNRSFDRLERHLEEHP